MRQWLKVFLQDERGMETVEWAVVAALLVLGAAAAFTTLGGTVVGKINDLNANVTT